MREIQVQLYMYVQMKDTRPFPRERQWSNSENILTTFKNLF